MNEILDAAYFGEIGVIRTLLANRVNRVDVNTKDRDGNTPLHMAVLGGHTNCVGLLIEKNANVDAVNSEGNNPLHLAVATAPPECIVLLLKAGALVNLRNNNGDTPLDYAIDQIVGYHTAENLKRHLALIDFLLQFDANARYAHKALIGIYQPRKVDFGTGRRHWNYSSYRRALLEKILHCGLEPDWADEHGDTLLHILCRCDAPSADLVLLLGYDINVDARNHAGETPLLVYLDKSKPPPLAGLMEMIDEGADVDAASHAGRTPIQIVKAFSSNEQTDGTRSQALYTALINCGADDRAMDCAEVS